MIKIMQTFCFIITIRYIFMNENVMSNKPKQEQIYLRYIKMQFKELDSNQNRKALKKQKMFEFNKENI